MHFKQAQPVKEHHESTYKLAYLLHPMKRDDFTLFPALFKEDYSSTLNRMLAIIPSSDILMKTDLFDESSSTTQLALICHNDLGPVNCDMQITM